MGATDTSLSRLLGEEEFGLVIRGEGELLNHLGYQKNHDCCTQFRSGDTEEQNRIVDEKDSSDYVYFTFF